MITLDLLFVKNMTSQLYIFFCIQDAYYFFPNKIAQWVRVPSVGNACTIHCPSYRRGK